MSLRRGVLSRFAWVAAGVMLLAGCTGAGEPEGVPTAVPAVEATPTPTLTPTSTPTPAADESDLEALRASDRYLAIAEHARAQEAPGSERTGQNSWDVFMEGGWSNGPELWDEVVGPVRDNALLAGDPAIEPVFDEAHADPERPSTAYIDLYWDEEATQGRGWVYVFSARYVDGEGGSVLRNFVVVIERDHQDQGVVRARREPFDLGGGDAPSWGAAGEVIRQRAWEWFEAEGAE